MNRTFLKIILSSFLAGISLTANAVTLTRADRLSPMAAGFLERAKNMLADGNHAGVIDQLKHLETQTVLLQPQERETCAYLLAYALYERGDADSVDALRAFAEEYPASPQALNARLAAADWFFFAHHYANAAAAYGDIDFSRINPADRPLYTYREALSLIKSGRFDEARPLLESIASNRSFSLVSEYYLAYLDYVAGNYSKALPAFENVLSHLGPEREKGIEPEYYIAQMEYARGNWRNAADMGNALIESYPGSELANDTRRITGLSLFKLGDDTAARKMLLDYVRHCETSPATDALYTLGVIAYSVGDFDTARRRFETVAPQENDLAQSASLYLGQLAAKEGDDKTAVMAFERAAKMDFDPEVTETALYNYAAALTHGGNIPFKSSIPLLRGFLSKYPSSRFAPRVQGYLATAYYNEKDYHNALASIRRIPHPTRVDLAMKQKILYELGIEAMSAGDAAKALAHLREGHDTPGDPSSHAQICLWLGDAAHQTGNYSEAERAYREYLGADRRGENRTLALYNLGYTLMMLERYGEAAQTFQQALTGTPPLPDRLRTDAIIRLADARYYTGCHSDALEGYTRAIELGGADTDYAVFRRAVMHGLKGDIRKKLAELATMPSKYPDSKWLPDALLETGQTYAGLGETANAVAAFERLKGAHRHTSQARRGMLDLALAYAKAGDVDSAEKSYREVISQWPTSDEALTAHDDLQRIYASKGSLREYGEFLASIKGAPRLEPQRMEQLSFEAAETAFANDVKDTRLLEKYVAEYPAGRNAAQAWLDIATGRDEKGDPQGAAQAVDKLLETAPDSPQVPEALLLKAETLEGSGAEGRKEALKAYRMLAERGGSEWAPDANAGIMRTTDNREERLEYARRVIAGGGLPADKVEEARYHEATALLESGDGKSRDKGVAELRALAGNSKSLTGAMAAVALGEHLIGNGDIAGADKVLTEFTDGGTPHSYWLARGFIALADVCHARGKDYLAKEYLKSLADNYPGRELDIHDMISTRLKKWK